MGNVTKEGEEPKEGEWDSKLIQGKEWEEGFEVEEGERWS